MNEIYESVFQFMTEEERIAFFDANLLVENQVEVRILDPFSELEGDVSDKSSALLALVDVEFWTGDSVDTSRQDDLASRWSAERFDVLVRERPNEVIRILMDPETPSATQGRIFGVLAASDSSHYELLSFVPERSRRQALSILMEIPGQLGFGPIDGREDPWSVDYEKLKTEVENLEMNPELRGQLLDDIQQYEEGLGGM